MNKVAAILNHAIVLLLGFRCIMRHSFCFLLDAVNDVAFCRMIHLLISIRHRRWERVGFVCEERIQVTIITKSLDNRNVKGKGMVLYSAVSSPLDRSKRFTLSSPGRPVHSDTVLGFSWKHSSHAAIAQRLFTHISTTVYSQVLIYTAESTEAS